MGFGIKELIIILVIIMLLFGTKKLKNMGADLGGALKGFKKSMAEEEAPMALKETPETEQKTATDDLQHV
ncbi:MAG: twin-arginine translocase TatA/TatE family subunit [Pseudomonadales bacterium]|nr:twin-arginine translocase TatA/TatE family subunit [Pseudomonadales bacterium]